MWLHCRKVKGHVDCTLQAEVCVTGHPKRGEHGAGRVGATAAQLALWYVHKFMQLLHVLTCCAHLLFSRPAGAVLCRFA